MSTSYWDHVPPYLYLTSRGAQNSVNSANQISHGKYNTLNILPFFHPTTPATVQTRRYDA